MIPRGLQILVFLGGQKNIWRFFSMTISLTFSTCICISRSCIVTFVLRLDDTLDGNSRAALQELKKMPAVGPWPCQVDGGRRRCNAILLTLDVAHITLVIHQVNTLLISNNRIYKHRFNVPYLCCARLPTVVSTLSLDMPCFPPPGARFRSSVITIHKTTLHTHILVFRDGISLLSALTMRPSPPQFSQWNH